MNCCIVVVGLDFWLLCAFIFLYGFVIIYIGTREFVNTILSLCSYERMILFAEQLFGIFFPSKLHCHSNVNM